MASASEHAASGPGAGAGEHRDADDLGGLESASGVEPRLDRWREFLHEQERLCAQHGFAAALVTIGLDRENERAVVLEALPGVLRSTDRAGILSDTEVSVALIPVESIHHAQRLVHVLDGSLRAKGVSPHVGWAMRLDGHGIFHASARADAAMLTARGHGRPAVDLSGT